MLVTSVTYVAGWVLGDLALRRRLGGAAHPGDVRAGRADGRRVGRRRGQSAGLSWNVTDDLLGTSAAGSLATVLVGTVVIGGVALAGLVVARVPEIREPLAAVRARTGRG